MPLRNIIPICPLSCIAPIKAVDMSVLCSPPRRRLAVALGLATLRPSESRKPDPAAADKGLDFGFLEDWFEDEMMECTPVFPPRARFFPGLVCFMYSSCALIKAGIDSVAALAAARLDLREEEEEAFVALPLLLLASVFPFRLVGAFLALLPEANSTCIRS